MPVSLLEDFVDPKIVDELEAAICDKEFAWYWMPSSRYGHTNPDHKSEDFQFTHTMYLDGSMRCELFPLAREIIFAFEEKTGYKVKDLYKLKANLLPRQTLSPDGLLETVHADLEAGQGKFMTIVYYVTDSDGPTVVYEGLTKYETHPKKGLAVYFPSDMLHRATPPSINKRRIVLNIIVELE